MRVGIIVPHIFMHRDILPRVIFSPAQLAIDLAEGIKKLGADVTIFTPGPIDTTVTNITADLSLFDNELYGRGYDYLTLLKKHPMTFVTMSRQVQAELVAKAYKMANEDKFDVLHIYTNEEEIGLVFADLCIKPVVFTHHDPFNFLVKYKNLFPKYPDRNWISMSYSQRKSMPGNTNWVANIYHGLTPGLYTPAVKPSGGYIAFLGRIIESKGVHLAINAINLYNQNHSNKLKLKIAGKHYSGHAKDTYWEVKIAPKIDNKSIFYEGFIDDISKKREFLANADALIVASIFEEPFGMVIIEALACGTPVIGLDSGAIPEIISNKKIGVVAKKIYDSSDKVDELATSKNLAFELNNLANFDRLKCREAYEKKFTLQRMCLEHLQAYKKITK